MDKKKFRTKDIALLAMLTAIIFAQEQILTFFPQFQFTILLLILYSKCLGFIKTTIIIIIHVLLDNLVMGSLNYLYTPAMLVGWLMIPVLINTIFKKVNSAVGLACCSIVFALLYSWAFIPISVFATDVKFWAYVIADIPFEIMLAVFSFLTVLWLYKPLEKVLMSLNDSFKFNDESNDNLDK